MYTVTYYGNNRHDVCYLIGVCLTSPIEWVMKYYSLTNWEQTNDLEFKNTITNHLVKFKKT